MALSYAVVAVVLATWGGAALAAHPVWMNNSDPALSFHPKGDWTNMPGASRSGHVTTCGDKAASISITLPQNATSVQWHAFLNSGAAAYLVCFDCSLDDHPEDALLVDAHQRASSNQSVLIWTSPPLLPNISHTMLIRNAVDPRFNAYSLVSMDALRVNVADEGDDPGVDPAPPAGGTDGISKPALIVGVIGGVEIIAILVAGTVFVLRRKRFKKRNLWARGYGWLGSDDKQRNGQYLSVRKSPEGAEAAPDLVLDIYDPTVKRKETSSSFGDIGKDLPQDTTMPPHGVGTSISTSRTPAPSQQQTSSTYVPSVPSAQRAQQHVAQPSSASQASHRSLISPEVRAQTRTQTHIGSATSPNGSAASFSPAKPKAPSPVAADVTPSAEAGPSSQPLIRYRDPFELRPPAPPATGSYGRPWEGDERGGSEESVSPSENIPPPPLQATFAAAYAPSQQQPHIPPLPFHLPPTRPVSEAQTISPIDDFPLPEFSSPPTSADLSHSFSPTGSLTRPSSAIIRPKRRPGGPRHLSGAGMQGRTRSSSLGGVVGSVIPEAEETSTTASTPPPAFTPPPTAELPLTAHTLASSQGTGKTRPVSKMLPPTPSSPLVESPTFESFAPTSAKGKAPEHASRIRIPSFRYARGRPRRKSTGSAAAHSNSHSSESPTAMQWEPDFLDFESTPEGTLVTVRSKHSNDTASSPLVPRLVEEDIDDGVLTVSRHSLEQDPHEDEQLGPQSAREPSWRSVPSTYDIAHAMRRVMRKDSPRLVETQPRYEQLS